MVKEVVQRFPGGSRSAVSRAGNAVRLGNATEADEETIEEWRAGHRYVLNSFQAILRNRTRGTDIIVAQRHKRKRTIYDKLLRLPEMQLGRMDDVAGCRLIFPDMKSLTELRAQIHGARFNHHLRNAPGKYDYIERPKDSGYRGIHDIYEYDVKSEAGQPYKGLYIELQYRTRVQHAWATTAEVIGQVTGNEPKFDRGDVRYRNVMRLSSEILARSFEGRRSSLPDLGDYDLVRRFVELSDQLQFMSLLRNLDASQQQATNDQNLILLFDEAGKVDVIPYRYATDALRDLFEFERERPDQDIVLVRGESSDVREAFQNYFSDARDFVTYIEEGLQRLMHAQDYGDHFMSDDELEALRDRVSSS